MKINDFLKETSFSVKRIIDFERMTVDHFIGTKKGSDLDTIDEDTYKDLIKFLNGRLKLTKRFVKEDEGLAVENSVVHIASRKEISELLESYRHLTEEQQLLTIKHLSK